MYGKLKFLLVGICFRTSDMFMYRLGPLGYVDVGSSLFLVLCVTFFGKKIHAYIKLLCDERKGKTVKDETI